MNVLVQIGRKKTNTWMHGISAKLILSDGSEEKISWETHEGTWITGPASRNFESFFIAEVLIETGDKIQITTFAKNGLGLIEKLCLKETYIADEAYEIKDFTIDKLCCKGFPLIKGRIEKVVSYSKENERDAQTKFKVENTEF